MDILSGKFRCKYGHFQNFACGLLMSQKLVSRISVQFCRQALFPWLFGSFLVISWFR